MLVTIGEMTSGQQCRLEVLAIEQLTDELMHQQLDTNVMGPLRCASSLSGVCGARRDRQRQLDRWSPATPSLALFCVKYALKR